MLAGFMAGLLGIGGGFIVVPLLLFVLPQVGLETPLVSHMAVGTSLACIGITSISSAYSHQKKQAIHWQLLKPIVPGLIIGAILGSLIAGLLQGQILVVLFVSGAIATAIYLLTNHQSPHQDTDTNATLMFSYANFTGVISSLIGIGGGSILVPFLVYRGVAMVKAVGTAAACGFPIALFGTIGYIYSGWSVTANTKLSSGYVYWPAFAGIVVFSALTAPLGAKLAHYIKEKQLKRVFAVFLILTSAQIIYSQWFSTAQ